MARSQRKQQQQRRKKSSNLSILLDLWLSLIQLKKELSNGGLFPGEIEGEQSVLKLRKDIWREYRKKVAGGIDPTKSLLLLMNKITPRYNIQ